MNAAVKYNWFYRYKLYHIPFWFAYHLTWWTISIGNFQDVVHNIFYSAYAYKFLFYVVFQALGVYFNLYYLVPKFLEQGRYVSYIILVLCTILGVAACIVPGYYFSAWVSGNSFREMYQHDPSDYMYFFKINTLPSSAASMTLGMSLKLAKNWVQTKKRQQILEKEKLETELKFLKSQFNPHFLFNSINSIFVLIHKNPNMASEALAKFSDLLRYQLYECNETQIPVGQEITYIENFIELEKLRQDDTLRLNICIENNYAGNLYVAPFILMPFIENAFKHVSRRKEKNNWIDMQLHFEKTELHFEIANSISKMYHAPAELIQYKGIGLKNVQRRLELLYANKHRLLMTETDEVFHVKLSIVLEETKIAMHTAPLELSIT